MTRSRTEAVTIGRRDGLAVFGGAQPCGTRFCPNCAPRIQGQRRDEIRQCVEAAQGMGWTVLFLTLTLAHSADDELADLLDGLDVSWRALTRGGYWNRTKRRHGIRHFIRVTEEQQGGSNGWHPHYHVLFFVDPTQAEAYSVADLSTSIVGQWARVVAAAGFRASVAAQMLVEPGPEHLAMMSGYFTKAIADSMSWEMTGQTTKRSRSGESRNPAELLQDAAAGDELSRRAWVELEQATRGRRMIAYSAHCRGDLRLEPAMRAEAAAQEAPPEPTEAMVRIGRTDWEEHSRRAGFREALAAVVATASEPSDVLWWLHDRGITAVVAPERPATSLEPPEVGPPGMEWLVSL